MFRDAKFLPHFRAVRPSDGKSKREALSVAKSLTPYTLTPQSPNPLKQIVSRIHSPAPWRDVSDPMRLLYYHHACVSSGPTIAFSLNLSPAIEAKARKQPSAAVWLLQRIKRELGTILDRPVVWFVLEETDAGRLHIHGEIVAHEYVLTMVREALRRAGGVAKAPGWARQVDLTPDATEGWTTYMRKRMALARKPATRSSYVVARAFSGDWIAATMPVKQIARRLYENDRQAVMLHLA